MPTKSPPPSSLRHQIVAVADVYCAARKRSRSTISTAVFGSGAVLNRLASGAADITTTKFERAIHWFDQNWPDDAVWPDGLPRPSLLAQAASTEAA